MTAQVAADLRAAADLLRRDGWTQGAFVRYNGCRCVAGALMGALDMDAPIPSAFLLRPEYDRWVAGLQALESQTGGIVISVWNDAPDRTADEVIAALEAAADAADPMSAEPGMSQP